MTDRSRSGRATPRCAAHHRAALVVSACLVTPLAWGGDLSSGAQAPDGPVLRDGSLVFPEGAAIPRSLTDVEREFLEARPLLAERGGSPPPSTPVRCPGEYEPAQGILIAWEPFSGGVTTILSQMGRFITTTGQAQLYVMVDSAGEQSTAATSLSSAGADMGRVQFFIVNTDTIWIRDYGPRYIYEGNVRAIIDHTYNRPRPNDDTQPAFWAGVRNHARYVIPLIHGGGNFHLSGVGPAYATRLIANENPSLTEPQIAAEWAAYQNVQTTITDPFPTIVDSTQHIDMWMQIIGPSAAIISDWPLNAGSTQDLICDATASSLALAGWTVTRVPAYSVSGVHYTFTNVVMCNDLVLLPSYTNATASAGNAPALAAWQAALPGKTIQQVPCQAIVTAAGVMHCIAMHVPAPLGGTSPTALLRTLRGPQTLTPGEQLDIRWSTDDDAGVANVDILLSTDAGASFPTVIASATADDGSFLWTVPSTYTTQARIRVVARDAQGNTGFDQSPADLFINAPPPPCPGDADGNGSVTFADITSVLTNFGFTPPPFGPGDADGNGLVNFADITAVLTNFGLPCP